MNSDSKKGGWELAGIVKKEDIIKKKMRIRSLLLAAIFGIVLAFPGVAGAETLKYTLNTGPYASTSDGGGFDRVTVEGFNLRGAPGNPLLSVKEYNILLPPDADFSTVRLTVAHLASEVLPGSFEIRPAAPDSAMVEGRIVNDWAGASNIVNGKNMSIYGISAFFPAEVIQLAPNAEMRKYRFLRVEVHPIQYNPVTKQIRYTTRAVVDIEFARKPEKASDVNLRDTVLDKEAPELFYNYEDGKSWYELPAGGDQPADMSSYDLLIVTTNAIRSGSSELDDFIASKRERGLTVKVITEDQYNSMSGSQRADKIRNWLKSYYLTYGIQYVLLIGDPTPGGTGSAAVPMKTCLPKIGESSTPTDMYYSDLSGDWDGDNDGTYGEWSDYYTYSDPDLYPEVKVGRIPVYSYNYTHLDSILQKIMDYQNTTASIAWRKATLLPMSFSESGYDGAPLAEQLWDDTLNSYGYTRYRMYQQGSGPCHPNSSYASDWELRGDRVRDRWKYNDYGIVCWWGHGSATSALVGYGFSCWDGILFNSTQCADLNNNHPAVVFQNSCTNGYPENSANLGYYLLLNGAIGTYSASRVSWFNTGVGYGEFDGNSTNSGIAYEVTRRVAMDYYLGNALYYGKSTVIGNIGDRDTRLMNQFDFNLYGDPTVTIQDQDTSNICQTLNDALENYNLSFVNGGDELWFCQKTCSAPLGGGDAAQSGDITNYQSSFFYTQVTGPGVITFYWKVSSEQNFDYLRFSDNGIQKYSISGNVDWQKKTYNVPGGVHTLKWSYEKDWCWFNNMDCGWVDLITYSTSPRRAMPWAYLLLLLDN